ncbi:hypothetical protein ACFLWZ_07350 [Chloroflexota bacterium]
MANKNEFNLTNEKKAPDFDKIGKRMDMLDQRLDNIDSVVTAVVERVMKQPITLNVTCSKCGQNIEIAILGTEKPSR